MADEFSWEDIDPAAQAVIFNLVTNAIGITPQRAKEFLEKSRAEGIEVDDVTDATGDFKHFLRTNHGWHGAVDVVWPHIEPAVRAVVEAVKQTGG